MTTAEDSFEAEGPMGIHLRGKGPTGMLALLIVTGFAGLVAVMYLHHKDMKEDHVRVENGMSEMVYIMSLSDEQRAKLRIAMPDSLRQKVRRIRDGD